MGRNPDLDGAFTPNILNSVVFLITMTMQVSTFAVNYQVCLGRVFAMAESSVWPICLCCLRAVLFPYSVGPFWFWLAFEQGHPFMISLTEHKYLFRSILGLYAFTFFLAAGEHATPSLQWTICVLVAAASLRMHVVCRCCVARTS